MAITVGRSDETKPDKKKTILRIDSTSFLNCPDAIIISEKIIETKSAMSSQYLIGKLGRRSQVIRRDESLRIHRCQVSARTSLRSSTECSKVLLQE